MSCSKRGECQFQSQGQGQRWGQGHDSQILEKNMDWVVTKDCHGSSHVQSQRSYFMSNDVNVLVNVRFVGFKCEGEKHRVDTDAAGQ